LVMQPANQDMRYDASSRRARRTMTKTYSRLQPMVHCLGPLAGFAAPSLATWLLHRCARMPLCITTKIARRCRRWVQNPKSDFKATCPLRPGQTLIAPANLLLSRSSDARAVSSSQRNCFGSKFFPGVSVGAAALATPGSDGFPASAM
jgi:hypothetical protein